MTHTDRYKKKNRRVARRRVRQAGFSLVEALMALAVFAVLAAAVGGAVVAAVQALTAAHADMLFTSKVSLTEDRLRKATAALRFPLWTGELPEMAAGDPLTLPYVNGSAQVSLRVSFEDSRLSVAYVSAGTGQVLENRTFTGFSRAEWAYLMDERPEPVGLTFTLVPEAPPQKTLIISERFGGAPLGRVYQ
jgi:prepilin-type N-terminal cleavage/methylation domain-containing protein